MCSTPVSKGLLGVTIHGVSACETRGKGCFHRRSPGEVMPEVPEVAEVVSATFLGLLPCTIIKLRGGNVKANRGDHSVVHVSPLRKKSLAALAGGMSFAFVIIS